MTIEKGEYTLDMIVADKDATWKWKINLHCFVCGYGEREIFDHDECATVFFKKDGKLIAGLICESCFNKWKEMKNE